MSKQEEYPPYDDRAFPDPRHLRDEIGSWEGKKALSLMNIDISLRRIADSIDIRKELDERTVECKKLTDELARMRVNCDMYADARDKAIAEKAALERRITKELSGGVVQVQSDLAAANQCIDDIAKTMSREHTEMRVDYAKIEDIIRAYREKKDKE